MIRLRKHTEPNYFVESSNVDRRNWVGVDSDVALEDPQWRTVLIRAIVHHVLVATQATWEKLHFANRENISTPILHVHLTWKIAKAISVQVTSLIVLDSDFTMSVLEAGTIALRLECANSLRQWWDYITSWSTICASKQWQMDFCSTFKSTTPVFPSTLTTLIW